MSGPRISVVLNVFKRSIYFEEQLKAVKKQSLAPIEILVWENGEEYVPEEFREGLTIARSDHNLGVWARFAYALNAKGEFICVIDDDTIPGANWLENCHATIIKTPGLLGTRGLTFENALTYSLNRDTGLYGPNNYVEKVDIVGHSWFFRKEWLSQFWAEFDHKFDSPFAGEDIHFSYALQKNLNLPTLVPPHPIGRPELWGSQPALAQKYGVGPESISKSKESLIRFEEALQHYRKLGFKTLNESQHLKSKYPNFIYKLTQKNPLLMHGIAKRIRKFRKQ